jgi:hypothetical protein
MVSTLCSGSSGPTPRGSFYYQHLFFAELTSYCRGCKGGRHQRRQLRWRPLSDLSAAPLGGLPSTSPAPVVVAARPTGITPQGAYHRCRQLRWWPLLDLPTATPRAPAINLVNSADGVSLNLVHAARIFLATPTRGHRGKQYCYEQGEMETRKKKFGSLRCQELGGHNTITEKSKSIDNVTAVSIIRITKRERKAIAGRKVYASSGSRLNRSATAQAAFSTPSLAASADPSMGPCTTGSRKMLGSRLRKHIST